MLAFSLSGWVTDLVSGHWWAYLIVFGACTLDSILFFLVPSEAVTISAGILAARGDLSIWLVIAAAAVGVFAGDNAAYWIGRLAGDRVSAWICKYERGRRWLEQGRGLIHRNGELVIAAGRFIPAGRSAATLSSGIVEFPYVRFAVADGVAAVIWAVYASLLGYLGGQSFEQSFWKPFVIALGIAALIAGGGEVWRRFQRRRGRDVLGKELEEAG